MCVYILHQPKKKKKGSIQAFNKGQKQILEKQTLYPRKNVDFDNYIGNKRED